LHSKQQLPPPTHWLFIINDQIRNAPVEFIFEKTKQSMKFTNSKPKSTR